MNVDRKVSFSYSIGGFYCLFDLMCLGNRSNTVDIKLPTFGCGVRSEPRNDGSVELSVRMVIQMDEKLRQRADIEKTVRCLVPENMMEMKVTMQETHKKLLRCVLNYS